MDDRAIDIDELIWLASLLRAITDKDDPRVPNLERRLDELDQKSELVLTLVAGMLDGKTHLVLGDNLLSLKLIRKVAAKMGITMTAPDPSMPLFLRLTPPKRQ